MFGCGCFKDANAYCFVSILGVSKEAERPSKKNRGLEIITTVYEDLVSQLTRFFSHAMIHALFFYFVRFKGVIHEPEQSFFSCY